MAVIEIPEIGRVEVDDAFLGLPADQQQQMLREIVSQRQGGASSGSVSVPGPSGTPVAALAARQPGDPSYESTVPESVHSPVKHELKHLDGGTTRGLLQAATRTIDFPTDVLNAILPERFEFIDDDALTNLVQQNVSPILPERNPQSFTGRTAENLAEGVGFMTSGRLALAGAEKAARPGSRMADVLSSAKSKLTPAMSAPVVRAEAAAAGGAEAGRRAIGGDSGNLDPLGELVGGSVPALARGAFESGAQALLSAPDSARRYLAAAGSGVPPTAGLVGNEYAARTENTLGLLPGANQRIEAMQRAQVGAASDELARQGQELRGFSPRGESPAEIGERVKTAAQSGELARRDELSALDEAAVDALGGPKNVASVQNTRDFVDQKIPTVSVPSQEILKKRGRQLERTRTKIVDEPLDRELRIRQSAAESRKRLLAHLGLPDNAQTMKQLDQSIAANLAEQDRNKGVTVEQLEDWRRWLGADTDSTRRLPKRLANETYREVNEDLRAAAAVQGTEDEFMRARTRAADIMREDMPGLEQYKTWDSGTAYNYLFGGQRSNPERLAHLKRNIAADEWDVIAGDMLEEMGRPKTMNQLTGSRNTETFSPSEFYSQWLKTPRATRDLLFPPEAQDQIEGLLTVAESLVQRGKNVNVSQSASTAIAAGSGAAVMSKPKQALAALTGLNVVARGFLSQELARIVGLQVPGFAERVLPRIARSTAGAASGEIEDASP